MLRKLVLLVCLFSATTAMAQNAGQGAASIKTTQKQPDPKIDYKQMGAPLLSFTLLPFHDTSKKIAAPAPPKNADQLTAKEKRQERKKEKELAKKQAEALAARKPLLTEKDFNNGANLFIMMFNPTCSHCTDQTQLFEKNIGLFKKSKLILMANPTMKQYLPNFVKSFHTDDYAPTISVGMDSLGFMNDVFLYQALPQINIYNGDRKLIKTFTGEVIIDSLMKYIQ